MSAACQPKARSRVPLKWPLCPLGRLLRLAGQEGSYSFGRRETDLSFTSTSSELDRGRHLLARSTMNRQLIGSATLGYIWLGCSVGSSLTAAPPDHCRTRCRGAFISRAGPSNRAFAVCRIARSGRARISASNAQKLRRYLGQFAHYRCDR